VSRRRLVVACPTGNGALAADRDIAAGLTRAGRTPPGWIREHLANGFPEVDAIRARMDPHGRVSVAPNLALAAHVRLIRAELRPALFVPTRLAAAALGAAYRAGGGARSVAMRALAALRGHDRGPTYRTVFVLDLQQ
jgi:hypothetical protein